MQGTLASSLANVTRSNGDDFDPITLGTDDPGEDVAVLRTSGGSALMVPASMRRLSGEQADLVAELQRAAVAVHAAQLEVDRLVEECRDASCSWGVVGWSVGTTAEAARQRWGT